MVGRTENAGGIKKTLLRINKREDAVEISDHPRPERTQHIEDDVSMYKFIR